MLRIALKILLAVSLLAQAGTGAFATGIQGSHAHHQHGAQHDTHGKMPCCPDPGSRDGTTACAACCTAFIAPLPFTSLSIEPMSANASATAAAFVSSAPVPPTPPPIA